MKVGSTGESTANAAMQAPRVAHAFSLENTTEARPDGNGFLVKRHFDLRKIHRRLSVFREKGRERRQTTSRKLRKVETFAFNGQVAMCLGDTREGCCIQHRANAGSIVLRHFIDTDNELHLGMTALLRDRRKKLVLGTASAASLP